MYTNNNGKVYVYDVNIKMVLIQSDIISSLFILDKYKIFQLVNGFNAINSPCGRIQQINVSIEDRTLQLRNNNPSRLVNFNMQPFYTSIIIFIHNICFDVKTD